MLRFILFIALLLFFISCSENVPEAVIQLNPDHADHEILSTFISDFDYIKLDTDQTSYIGNIEKIKAYKDRLYILDDRISNALYSYDYDGNLVYKIASYGRAPGEFLGPYDFVIDGNEVIHTTQELYEDDLNIGPLPLWPMAIVDQTLIWYSQPSALLRYVREKREQMNETEWSRFEEENQKLISFSESIAGDDNPYLLLTEIEF